MENAIRSIIQSMIKEPLIRTVIEDELSKLVFPDSLSLSPININKECDISLPAYNNAKIEIKGYQAKTLYIFYLLAPIGIANKELSMYKNILKSIYQEICRHKLNDEYRSENVINGLLEREGGISDATNKINLALKKVITEERIFKYYMISGKRNCERQIIIPKHLIEIDNDVLNKIGKWEVGNNFNT